MALKIMILMFLVLTVTKACDLDLILEDIYDDTDSGEDESTEKPANNQNNVATPAPNESTSITTKPFPIIPQADAAPVNSTAPSNGTVDTAPVSNSAPSNGTSRAKKEKSEGKRHHRRTHHRRHVLRRVPVQDTNDYQNNANQGRGFGSEFDLFSILGRYPHLERKNLLQEKSLTKESHRAVPLISPVERENDNEQERSFTTHDFITERHVPFIELPEGRIGGIDLDQNNRDRDLLESEDFIKVLVGPLERKNVEEQLRSSTVDDSISLVEIPKERIENLESGENVKEKEEEEEVETDELDEQVRSSTDDDFDDGDVSDFEMPEGRMGNLKLRKNIRRGEHNKHFITFILRRPERKNVKKRIRPSTTHASKSDVRRYVKEYLNKLLIRERNSEHKMHDSNEYVYIPVPKRVLNKHRYDSSHSKNEKGSHLVSLINREYSYKHPEHVSEERTPPSVTKILVYNGKPIKVQNSENSEQQSHITLLLSQEPSKESEETFKPISSTQHLMIHNQNPRNPILINSYDSDTHRLVEEPHSEISNPSINHVNHVKEYILRETTKVNPIDHSEIRNVHEQTRLSIIKNPHVPIDLTLDKPDLVVKEPGVPQQGHLMPNNLMVQQLPPINSKINDFHEKYSVSNNNLNQGGNQVELQHQHWSIQQLPMVNSNINFRPAISSSAPSSQSEGHNVQEPHLTKLSDVYLHAHSYPINYPINSPVADHKQQAQPTQEDNFYVKPQASAMENLPTLQHDAVSGHSNTGHQMHQLPLLDMIDNFKGHHLERPMQEQGPHHGESLNHDVHHGSLVATTTSPHKHVIINAV